MAKFKVGDIVKGISNHYGMTNKDMVRGKVMGTDENGKISIKILETKSGYVSSATFTSLDPEDFALVDEKPKFKVGDRVRVRSWRDMEKEFNSNDSGIPIRGLTYFSVPMRPLCGRTAIIKELPAAGNHIKLENWSNESGDIFWNFTTEMLEPVDKFEAGQIYRIGKGMEEEGNIIKIVNTTEGILNYSTIRGKTTHSYATPDSAVAESLTLLTGKEIDEAIRKYDAEHSKTGVREVKRPAKVGEWVKILTGDGHHAPVGGTFQVVTTEALDGWIRVRLSDSDSTLLRIGQYVVLEGYKPEQKGKHAYTSGQIAEAKKLCGEMMVEAFDDGSTFNLRFLDRNQNEHISSTTLQLASFSKDDVTATAKCSDHDGYNVWIGRCVALCKALHKPVPAFIMGDGNRHFDLEKARCIGKNENVRIHCKNHDECVELSKALDALGYRWGATGERLTERFYKNDMTYKVYSAIQNGVLNADEGKRDDAVEFSDCFTED